MTQNNTWLEAIDNDPRLGAAEYAAALALVSDRSTDFEFDDARAHLMLTIAGYIRPVAIDGDVWTYQTTTPQHA